MSWERAEAIRAMVSSNVPTGRHHGAPKLFQSVAADPAKVKTYCEMSKVMEGAGDQADAATEQKIQTLIKQLGPEFETACNVGGELDENSPDATAYNSTLDDLSSKCS